MKYDLALHPINTIEFCAGVGMLGEGLRAGLEYLGIPHRTIVYVEREAHAASVLVSRMQEGSLDEALIWSDLLTFDSRCLRGRVDWIAAGFPCQDLSLAGRRAGLDGSRSGLFFDILDHADASGAWGLFLENVAGIASATSTVMDEAAAAEITGGRYRPAGDALGEPDEVVLERAAARVLGELAERGWHTEYLTLSAADVGASHGRLRWFCFAWRRDMADSGGGQLRRGSEHREDAQSTSQICGEVRQQRLRSDVGAGCSSEPGPVADTSGHGGHGPYREGGSGRGVCAAGDALADTERAERRPERVGGTGSLKGHDAGGREEDGGPGVADAVLGYPDSQSEQQPGQQDGAEPRGRPRACSGGSGGSVGTDGGAEFPAGVGQADTGSTRCEGPELGSPCDDERDRPYAHGSAGELCGLFAPGPADPRWADIIARNPELAPALEPTFRSEVNGLAFDMDDSRAARLKCVGNGVVPLAAAAAAVVLLRRAGFVK